MECSNCSTSECLKVNSTLNKTLNIFLLNIQSTRRKMEELYVYLETINFPDLVLLTESWLQEGEYVQLHDYNIIARFDRSQIKHGGILALQRHNVPKDLAFREISTFNNLIIEQIFEFTVIFNDKLDLYILCIYRTNNPSLTHLNNITLFLMTHSLYYIYSIRMT